MKTRKMDIEYELDGELLSAWQRNEVIEFDSETETARVVSKWTNYEVAREACERYNELAYEREALLEKHKKEISQSRAEQYREFSRIMAKESQCQCANCIGAAA
jgi:hypothetical protein